MTTSDLVAFDLEEAAARSAEAKKKKLERSKRARYANKSTASYGDHADEVEVDEILGSDTDTDDECKISDGLSFMVPAADNLLQPTARSLNSRTNLSSSTATATMQS